MRMKIDHAATGLKRARLTTAALGAALALLLLADPGHGIAQVADADWPRRVLITNDDGIDDPKIGALARAFARVAETYVAAPLRDRSGTSNYLTIFSDSGLVVERRDLGEGIVAYGVDGYPADCIAFGLRGLLADDPPDLVVSGINSGPNLAGAWIASGTIGAARMAAFLGYPALAVSGLDDDDPEAVAAATRWVVELARSEPVRRLEPGGYITVSIPRIPPAEIRGIRVVRRAPIVLTTTLRREVTARGDGREIWVPGPLRFEGPTPTGSDADVYRDGYIAVVPMRLDEHDGELLHELRARTELLPVFGEAVSGRR